MDTATFEKVGPTGMTIPGGHLTPKLYQDGTSLRPTLDICDFLCQAVRNWLSRLLEIMKMAIPKHTLRNNFHCINAVENLDLQRDHFLSLDVVSFLTEFFIDETINSM